MKSTIDEALDTEQSNQQIERLGFFSTVWHSIKHIQSSLREDNDKARKMDLLSACALPLLLTLLANLSFAPGFNRSLVIGLTYVTAMMYFFARLGIVRTLGVRQTSLVTQLFVASFIAGCMFVLACMDFLGS